MQQQKAAEEEARLERLANGTPQCARVTRNVQRCARILRTLERKKQFKAEQKRRAAQEIKHRKEALEEAKRKQAQEVTADTPFPLAHSPPPPRTCHACRGWQEAAKQKAMREAEDILNKQAPPYLLP